MSPADVERNRAVVRQFLETMGEGHFGLVDDDAEFWVLGTTSFSGMRTKADIVAGFASFVTLLAGPFEVTVLSIACEGDMAFAEASATAPMKDGRTYTNRYCYAFRLAGGRIRSLHEYVDTAYLVDFFK